MGCAKCKYDHCEITYVVKQYGGSGRKTTMSIEIDKENTVCVPFPKSAGPW
jgi:hypothetical protein